MRPSTIRTSSCTPSAIGSTPRTSTFSRPPSRRRKNGCTTSSGDASGSPSALLRDAVEEAQRLVGLERHRARAVVVRALAQHDQVVAASPWSTSVRRRLDTSARNSVVAITTSATTAER